APHPGRRTALRLSPAAVAMIIASMVARAGAAAMLGAAVLSAVQPANVARAQSQSNSATPMEARISALVPALEAYIRSGMKAFDVRGVAFGMVTGDRLVGGGDVFAFRLLPRGRFAAVVASMGERPPGFAQLEVGQDGKLGVLRLTADDGQAWEFRRD